MAARWITGAVTAPGVRHKLVREQYRPGSVGPCDPLESGRKSVPLQPDIGPSATAAFVGPLRRDHFSRLSLPAPSLERATTAEGSSFERPATLEECFSTRGVSRPAGWGATELGVEAISNSAAGSAGEPGSVRLRFSETKDSVRIGAALPLTDIGCDDGAPERPRLDATIRSPPYATEPRWEEIWRQRRPSRFRPVVDALTAVVTSRRKRPPHSSRSVLFCRIPAHGTRTASF